MKRIRFHVSDAFLQKFEKILGDLKAVVAATRQKIKI